MRSRFLLLVAAVLTVLTGCFQLEQSVKLQRNLAGQAGFRIVLDFEPMVYSLAASMKALGGDTTPLTEAEFAKSKEEFLKDKPSKKISKKSIREGMKKNPLPEGLSLLDATVGDEGLKVDVNLTFAFDHLSRLQQLDLSTNEEEGSIDSEMLNHPFDGLHVEDRGDSWLVRTVVKQVDEVPLTSNKEEGGLVDPLEQSIDKILESMHYKWEIEVPTKILEHNAQEVHGQRLVWIWKGEEMDQLDKGADVFVRFAKFN
ncbi:MAG: hypothetical protein HN348_02560 [Proteobacteria bacterium]|nr:hypothetical protein [Pseudomonadota bacterium]